MKLSFKSQSDRFFKARTIGPQSKKRSLWLKYINQKLMYHLAKTLAKILLLAAIAVTAFHLSLTATVFFMNFSDSPFGQKLAAAMASEAGLSSLPWYISRSSAIAAYVMMFLVVSWGLGMTIGLTYKIAEPVRAWIIHKYMSFSLGVLVIIHVFSLLFDEFIKFGLKDILVPLSANFKPLYLNLGIISFYFLLAVITTSVFLRLKTPKFWRTVHYLTYPLFLMTLLHGLFIGTDSKLLAMKIVYLATGIIFLILLSWRFLLPYLVKGGD